MAENAVNTEQGVILEALNNKADLDGNNLTGTGFEDYIRSIVGSSSSGSGYKVQCGYVHLTGTATGSNYVYSYTGTITFPEPFDIECLSFVNTHASNLSDINTVLTNTNATIKFILSTQNVDLGFWWIAIGH